MNALLDMEPRDAGSQTIEPAADFATEEWVNLHDRARCLISVHLSTRIC